jgi:hypothetical protein
MEPTEPMQTQPKSDASPTQSEKVVAPPSRDPTVRYTIIAIALVGVGAWCAHDIFILGKHPYGTDINTFSNWAFNWGGMILGPLAGIAALIYIKLVLRRQAVADAQGVGFAGKERIAWDRIHRIDAQKLRDKGILDLYYDQGRKLSLDSWKLTNFKPLVAYIEAHLPADVKRS